HIWTDTDPDRTGILPFVFEDGMGFQRYADHALDVPMYFVYRDGEYIDASGQSFRDFLDGRLPALQGELPTITDWDDHLTTLFPEVRMKRFLEMRGADGGPWRSLCALPAIWVGILYHQASLDAAWDLIKDWSLEEHQALRDQVPKTGLATSFRDRTVLDLAKEMLKMAEEGLRVRSEEDWAAQDERQFLTFLHGVVDRGRTPAEDKLDAFHGRWQGSIDPIFAEFAY
ncbi:MAG: glutamate--cysteine ligase, partial [Geminicoccaceae bacterium]